VRIRMNGKPMQCDATSLWKLREERYQTSKHLVVIFNGFQTDQDLALSEGDEVVFIEKGRIPQRDEFEAMLSARHTPHVYERVRRARVAVAGLGGLGSTVAVALARTGIGFLHLVDFDIVEPSNLNRQQYGVRHLGQHKTEALATIIGEINPYVRVHFDTVRVCEQNIAPLFREDDIVCEAFDRADAKAMLVNGVLEHLPGKKIVAASGLAGYESSNTITTRKVMKYLYLCGDGDSDARPGRGLMAPRVSICAGHQANMILRLIQGSEDA